MKTVKLALLAVTLSAAAYAAETAVSPSGPPPENRRH